MTLILTDVIAIYVRKLPLQISSAENSKRPRVDFGCISLQCNPVSSGGSDQLPAGRYREDRTESIFIIQR